MTSLLRTLAASLLGLATFVGAAEPAAASTAPGSFTGSGFDACDAPASATMDAWLASPYRAVGIYVGGQNRACKQLNLTPDWVAHQQANGWQLLPIYLGLQAPCTTSGKKYLIDPAQAAAQGRAEAAAAVASAGGLGLGRGSTLIFDMEAYKTADASCTSTVLTFLGAWTSRLHDLGYASGVYGSLDSTVHDLVLDYGSLSRPHPDYLDFARYDGVASVGNPAIPADYWAPHRRIHQYLGGHDEAYGGVTINVDLDYVDVQPLPAATFGDFSGNGWTDLLGRNSRTGELYLYRGNGTNLEPRSTVGVGWQHYDVLTRFGDFNGDGHEDLLARNAPSGYLWLYPGTGSGFGPRVRVGTGWNRMREITAVGDLTGDHHPDLLAVQISTGELFLYPGRGTGFGARIRVGGGWNAMSELTGVGDLTGDGRPDLLARQTSTGVLYLYPGRGGASFGPRQQIGTGWSARRNLTGVGDFDRDGLPDLMSVDTHTGALYLNRGRLGGLQTGIRLSTGWTSIAPLA